MKQEKKGEWLYAVSVIENPDFWLNTFLTKKEAITFCKKQKLPIETISRK